LEDLDIFDEAELDEHISEVIENHWADIKAVAEHLLVTKKLTGDEVREIMERKN
jgi:hypothetical protein